MFKDPEYGKDCGGTKFYGVISEKLQALTDALHFPPNQFFESIPVRLKLKLDDEGTVTCAHADFP